ncbi:POK9 protein, partial [Sclerurus mexicanus]|nr:POK9 protein [Sclerurus mexicanus]
TGSLGLDLEAAVAVTIYDSKPRKIPTTTHGPLSPSKQIGALLIGRSSSGLNGLIVLPGVIDADYEGQVMVVAYTPFPPLTIEQGTRIAQLVLYEKHPSTPAPMYGERKAQGFGSTGQHVVSLVQKMQQRPLLTVLLKHQQDTTTIIVMCDTGADVTIVS